MTNRRTITALVGALLVSADAAAATSCRVIDATANFWPLVASLAEATPAEQASAFRADVIARFPDLYTRDVLGTGDSRQLDEEAVAALAATRRNRMSAKLNPGRPLSDAMIFPPDLAERAAPQIERLARALRDNDAPNAGLYAEYFEVSSANNEIPPRAGYYVGYRVASLAAREYSLYRLAHLRGPSLHREINRWLDELVNGKGG
jgi:hypothetical protein